MIDSQPCSAATENSPSGIASANVLAKRASVVGSITALERVLRGGGGGNAGSTAVFSLSDDTPDDDDMDVVSGDEFNGSQVNPGISSVSASKTMSEPATDDEAAKKSSDEGKKLRKRASHCHLLAFLNSTHTSMRPGRESAGSRRSR
jgi:trehalose-6-phosphatase